MAINRLLYSFLPQCAKKKKVSKEEKKIVRRKKRIFFIIVTLRRIFFPPFFLSHFLESTCSDKKKVMYKKNTKIQIVNKHIAHTGCGTFVLETFSLICSHKYIHNSLTYLHLCVTKKCAFLSPFFVNFFSSFLLHSRIHIFFRLCFFSH